MKKNLSFIGLLLLVLLLILGCVTRTKLADYQPNSAEEKVVLDFMNECDEAYQDRNMTKWLDCFDESAQITIYQFDLRRNAVVSKQQYKEYLEGGGDSNMPTEITDPKVTLIGNKATMKCINAIDTGFPMTFDMVNEEEQWRITRFDWQF